MAWDWLSNNSNALLAASAGLLGGRTANEQASMALQGFAGARQATQQQNKTIAFLKQINPQLAQAVEAGAMSPLDAYKSHLEAQKPKKPIEVNGRLVDPDNYSVLADFSTPAKPSFQTLPDGTYGWSDPNTQSFNAVGKAQKPGSAEYETRKAAAAESGLTPDNPAYQGFVLTGKMPREDQTSLTAVDKKAILEADDMVAVNENAIQALDAAIAKSENANSGWLSGARATIGNNLPDMMVPDVISSPESSAATTDFDNAIVGQALGQLKAIFGGAPTEGERAILLQLQGSSNLPKPVRETILKRARDMAAKRLEFNRQRADSLRGGSFYKPVGGQQQPAGAATKTGVQWSIEP